MGEEGGIETLNKVHRFLGLAGFRVGLQGRDRGLLGRIEIQERGLGPGERTVDAGHTGWCGFRP